jgi:hypothetical protein
LRVFSRFPPIPSWCSFPPKDLREIPRHFGQSQAAQSYGAYSIEILAEINNAPKLSPSEFRAAADYLRGSGADVIDVGCTPGLPFPNLASYVRELRSAGIRVSIDSFDPEEILAAVDAGAELVLSVNRTNLAVARELSGTDVRVVVIPDFGEGLETLERNIEDLERLGVRYLIDPVIDGAIRGGASPLSRRGPADGGRQHHRADQRRHHRGARPLAGRL